MTIPKFYFNWSSGKDSALTLYHLQQSKQFNIDLLLTSINTAYDRVSMHGLHKTVLQRQTDAIGIPSQLLELPESPTMDKYNAILKETVKQLKTNEYHHCGFGDIFLEDLKNYREKQLKAVDIQAHFPLWKRNTTELIHEFIDLGFKSKIICLNNHLLDEFFLGQDITHELIEKLPKNIDPCGENGEFHTFCYDGPIFQNPVDFKIGKTVKREYNSPSEKGKTIPFLFLEVI